MNKTEWAATLQTFHTTREVAEQTTVGLIEHINTPCTSPAMTTILANRWDLEKCDRGTPGCNLDHNDKEAVIFARMAFERILELEVGDEPMPDIAPTQEEVK